MERSEVPPQELAGWVVDAATRAEQLVADLTDEQLIGPLLPTVNPLLWEIGHIAWFQELFVLRRAAGHEPILDFGDACYDSGAIPHDTRWRLALPTREQTVGYLRTVAQRVAEEVTAGTATDVVRHFARYTTHHHDTHTEAFTYTRQTLALPEPQLAGLELPGPGRDAGTASADTAPRAGDAGAQPRGDAQLGGGRFVLGAQRTDAFVFDNEKWAHPVELAPFAMAKTAVTQAEFTQFVADGGYRTPALWSDGGAWLAATGARHPVYWREGPSGWQRRHFDTWVELEPDVPVQFLSWWEADAYCRWAGRRLPTEAEWEFAATAGKQDKSPYPWGSELPGPRQAATDWAGPAAVGACPAGDSPDGCRQLIGNVWEWTASDFTAYPNFERDAYAENSEQFFGHRKVLRGGGWATRGRYLRSTLRNYFTPERRDTLAGLRTCAVE